MGEYRFSILLNTSHLRPKHFPRGSDISVYLCEIGSKSHFPTFTKGSYETCMADKKFNGSLGNSFGVVKDKIGAFEVFEVVTHDPGNETLQFLHVQRTRNIGLRWARHGPAEEQTAVLRLEAPAARPPPLAAPSATLLPSWPTVSRTHNSAPKAFTVPQLSPMLAELTPEGTSESIYLKTTNGIDNRCPGWSSGACLHGGRWRPLTSQLSLRSGVSLPQ